MYRLRRHSEDDVRKYLVTGGAGFIGSNFVHRLLGRGENVTIYDNLSRAGAPKNLAWLEQTFGKDAFRLIVGDIRDANSLAQTARGMDVIAHLAGQVAVTTSVIDPRQDFEANALGTFNALEAAPSPAQIPSSSTPPPTRSTAAWKTSHPSSRLAACLAVAAGLAACGSGDDASARRNADPLTTAATPSRPPTAGDVAAANQGGPRIVGLGDSLTAGLGLPIEDAYPALLQQRLDAKGLKYQVINAGNSGDTSAAGLSRLDWALQGDVRILIVALGGNDALRGLPVSQLKENLARIIQRAQARGVTVVLAGMEAPPNWGDEYHQSVSRGVSRARESIPCGAGAVSARRRGRHRPLEPARWHSSDSRRGSHGCGHRVEGPRTDRDCPGCRRCQARCGTAAGVPES